MMMIRNFLLALFVAMSMKLAAGADPRDQFEVRTFDEGGYKLPYRLLRPKVYDATKKFPLVIFLHGAGERGADNEKQLVHGMSDFAADDVTAKYPAFVMAPQCPEGEAWGGINRLAKNPTPAGQLAPALAATLKAADVVRKEFSIDEKRIYITGLSMGGYGSWAALTHRPELFAGAAIICGGGDAASVSKFQQVPVWVFHGDEDKVVPIERSREMVAALKAAGAAPKYTEYPGVGHNSWAATYANRDVYEWLFAQKKN